MNRTEHNTQISERLLTTDEVAERLSLSKRAVFRMRSAGLICPCVRVGQGAIRWRLSDLENWIKLGCCTLQEFQARKEAELCHH
jgi:excisionase family DNA binding protein